MAQVKQVRRMRDAAVILERRAKVAKAKRDAKPDTTGQAGLDLDPGSSVTWASGKRGICLLSPEMAKRFGFND